MLDADISFEVLLYMDLFFKPGYTMATYFQNIEK
jgi:hypothetical protein